MREPTPGPIFVGGTGRSGTSVLKQLIGTHPAVFAAPNEAKFLVEPDGLIDLVDALSTHWSPWKSERALARFDRFMRSLSWRGRWAERRVRGIAWRLRRLRSRDFSLARYSNERLGDRLGREHYFGTLADFLAEMEELRFPGWWSASDPYRVRPQIHQGRRFPREEIAGRSAAFVDALFAPSVAAAGAQRWCEDTPENAMHAAFLHELFPAMRMIAIYRDPRDVVASGKRHAWAPPDAARGARRIAAMHARWEEQRERLPEDAAMELRFETLIAEPDETLASIWRFLGLPEPAEPHGINLSRHHIGRYRSDLSAAEIADVESVLGPWMIEHGYPLS